MEKGSIVVYCIANAAETFTYVGWTNYWARRLRQHKQELKGKGAKATRSYGQGAHPIFVVTGLQTKQHALQLEWRLHCKKPGKRKSETRVAWRRRRLQEALTMERFTAKAPAHNPGSFEVVWFV